MHKLNNKLNYFGFSKKYYEPNMSILDIFYPVKYIQYLGDYQFGNLMYKTPYYTKHITLKPNNNLIKKSFSKGLRYKINKATRDNIQFKILDLNNDKNIQFYLKYYNEFAKSKQLFYTLSKKEITSFLGNFTVTYAEYNGEILVMHGLFINQNNKTVYIHQSSSHYRKISINNETITKNFISNANCFLHYKEMVYFKKQNMLTYDLGGYTMYTNDQDLIQINQFKDSFKGELIQQNHYESYLFLVLNKLYHYFKKIL